MKENSSIKKFFVVVLLIAAAGIAGFGAASLKARKQMIAYKERQEIVNNDALSSDVKQALAEGESVVVETEEEVQELDIGLVNDEVKEIGELATEEYLYTDASYFSEKSKWFNKIENPFSKKSFICQWDGTIKAGIDATLIEVEVNEDKKVLTVSVPKAVILSHEIDLDSWKTLDEKNNVFNPIKVDDGKDLARESMKKMEERAIKNGLLDNAESSAEALISGLLNADPLVKDVYTIRFDWK